MKIAIRPDGSWWDIEEDGAEGDCDDVKRVKVPVDLDPADIDEWALRQVEWPLLG